MEKFKRNCPNCNKILEYTIKCNMIYAENDKKICNSCAKLGKNNPQYGKKRPDISQIMKKRSGINNPQFGKKRPEHSKRMSGINNPTKRLDVRKKISKALTGRKLSEEHIKQMRVSAIKRIENQHGQIYPNYNPLSISIIEQKAKELRITDLVHAENGREFYIKELGYWVDGYSKEKNVVIEYYEPFHKKQKERDKRRKQEIINYLKCDFIEIQE